VANAKGGEVQIVKRKWLPSFQNGQEAQKFNKRRRKGVTRKRELLEFKHMLENLENNGTL